MLLVIREVLSVTDMFKVKLKAELELKECVTPSQAKEQCSSSPTSSQKACTLAIIKPDAVVRGKTDEIIMKIQEAGFDVVTDEERTMTEAEM
ncbi:Thioredoxin Domain-Containing Protein 6 [Manis pentadactyla]|nr:Thioredoxin Domain-Containing Protein 6 [Manis pentadactyla]